MKSWGTLKRMMVIRCRSVWYHHDVLVRLFKIDRTVKYVRSLCTMMISAGVLEQYMSDRFPLVRLGPIGHKLVSYAIAV
jgi:hypothetical protein